MRVRKRAHAARLEARPFLFENLTPLQKEAWQQVEELVANMTTRKPDRRPPTRLLAHASPIIDNTWWSTVILLEGQRGSGKTCLFLSLLSHWMNELDVVWGQGQFRPPRRTGNEPPVDPRRGEAMPIPLMIIDMQTLSPETNLIHLIGQCLRRVIEDIEESLARTPGAAHNEAGPRLASQRQWSRFTETISRAWNANLPERRGSLDPEDYALELDEAERHRLSLSNAFYTLADAIERDFKAYMGVPEKKVPMFVVPIDDSDMNPELTFSMMKMFRTLWHPRVVYLLTGHSDLFINALRSHFLRSLYRGAHDVRAGAPRNTFSNGDHIYLADEVYRRVIPPNNRCQIVGVPARDRLPTLEGLTPRNEGSHEGRTLGQIRPYLQTWEFLCDALPESMRRLEDLGLWLAGEEPTVPELLHRLWEEVCHRAIITHEQQTDLLQSMRLADEHTLEIGASLLKWRWELHDLDQQRIDERVFFVRRPDRFVCMLHDQSGAPVPLANELAATLMLGICWAADNPEVRLIGMSSALCGAGEFVAVNYPSARLGREVTISWPQPDWTSFLDLARFGRYWEDVVERNPLRSTEPERLARYYLHGVAALARGGPTARLEVPATPPEWRGLAEDLRHLAEESKRETRSTSRAAIYGAWARWRAPLLAAPEYGLRSDDANTLLKALGGALAVEKANLILERRASLRRALASQPAAPGALSGELESLLEDLDFEVDFEWSLFEERRPRFRTVTEFLGHSPVVCPPSSFRIKDRSTALDYLPPHVVMLIESSHYAPLLLRNKSRLTGDPNGIRFEIGVSWADWAGENEDRKVRDAVRLAAFSGELRSDDLFERHVSAEWTIWSGTNRVHLQALRLGAHIQSGLLDALYRFAWDITADTQDTSSVAPHPPAGHDLWWRAIEVEVFNHRRIPWPGIAWPATRDLEATLELWHDLCKLAVQANRERRYDGPALIDALAAAWVAGLFGIADSRTYDPMLRLSLAGEIEWSQLVIREHHHTYEGARWSAYQQFLAALPLLAAPESGLSTAAAEAILAASRIDTPERWRELEQLRHARLLATKGERTRLADIDKAHVGHPWLVFARRFEKAGEGG